MTELLDHPKFGKIRIEKQNGEFWFCAKDVCGILGFSNSRDAIKHHCFEGDVEKIYSLTEGGKQELNFVNESGLYALIFNSEKTQAKLFKYWVTSEVLPSIRKYGFYSTNQRKMDNAVKRAEVKAKRELFKEINGRLSTTDKKLIAKQCLTTEYEVNRVLKVEKEDVYMATLLFNKAMGNKELYSEFYTMKGAEDMLKILIQNNR